MHDDFKNMFESDEYLLIDELVNLPKSCADRKVNEVVKRIRIIKVHISILTYLKKKTPKWFGKKKAMESLINNLEQVFDDVKIEYKLSDGDFPDIEEFRHALLDVEDFSNLLAADKKTLQKLDDLIMIDIPTMMKGATALKTPTKKHKPKINKSTRKSDEAINIDMSRLNEKALDLSSEVSWNKNYVSIFYCDVYLTQVFTIYFIQSDELETEPRLSYRPAVLMLCKFFYVYALIYFLVNQGILTSLPTSVTRHFSEVDMFIKSYLFDSVPSKDLLV